MSQQDETLEGVIQTRKDMTPEQMKEVAARYAAELKKDGYIAIENRGATGASSQMGHIVWMCERISMMLSVGSTYKAHRWLGFIQGVLWVNGYRTIDQMAEQNRGM